MQQLLKAGGVSLEKYSLHFYVSEGQELTPKLWWNLLKADDLPLIKMSLELLDLPEVASYGTAASTEVQSQEPSVGNKVDSSDEKEKEEEEKSSDTDVDAYKYLQEGSQLQSGDVGRGFLLMRSGPDISGISHLHARS
jgi:hypothetical protein